MGSISLLEWVGYLASVLVLISMLMNSFLKLRIVNLVYGFLIGSLPVGLLNMFIVFANIYHLIQISKGKESFSTLEIRKDNRYLIAFLDFYKKDLKHFFPSFDYNYDMNCYSFLILRNMAVSGVFLAREYGNNYLYVGLDYVISQYRDLKPGRYIYREKAEIFKQAGFTHLCTIPQTKSHCQYLKKMGFSEELIDGKSHMVLSL